MTGTRRRPDVGVECGERDEGSFEAEDVRFVGEVLSPSTREFDMFEKLDEYRAIPTMRYVLLVEPNAPTVMLWSREDDMSWRMMNLEGRDAIAAMPGIGVSLKLDDIYGILTFRPAAKLVLGANLEVAITSGHRISGAASCLAFSEGVSSPSLPSR